jgi:hypothetical protein
VRDVLGGWAQQKGKLQKAKDKGGAGGGPSNKETAAGSSSGETSTSRGEAPPQHATISKRWPPQHGGGCSAARAPFRGGREWCATDAASGGGKKEKERQRKERQRQRRMEEAKEALQVAIESMWDARCVSPLWLMRLALAGTLRFLGSW